MVRLRLRVVHKLRAGDWYLTLHANEDMAHKAIDFVSASHLIKEKINANYRRDV